MWAEVMLPDSSHTYGKRKLHPQRNSCVPRDMVYGFICLLNTEALTLSSLFVGWGSHIWAVVPKRAQTRTYFC